MDSSILLAASYSPGITKAQLWGRNAAIGTSVETVWTTGGTYAQLTAGVLRTIGGNGISLQGLGIQKGDTIIDFGLGIRLEEKTLIELRAIVSTGVGDMTAMADLFLFDRSIQKWVQ